MPLSPLVGGEAQQAFASPDANNPQPFRVATVDNPKRRMDNFSKKRLIELGHNATNIRVIYKSLDPIKNFCDQSVANLGYTLLSVPVPYLLQVAQRRLC